MNTDNVETPWRSPFALRRAGVLLHPTSLPGPGANGRLGEEAFRFIDFMAAAKLSVWQTLPLGPPHADLSPYQCTSVFAGNPALIDFEDLVRRRWLDKKILERKVSHMELLQSAYASFSRHAVGAAATEFEQYCEQQSFWLADFALYRVIRHKFQDQSWTAWPAELRDRRPEALNAVRAEQEEAVRLICFEQFLFNKQWLTLKQYANERGILLFGDLPIFVAHDSAEVWAARENFQLNKQGEPKTVAGVPPDYFSKTGQRWGNPHYDWKRMAGDDFLWWRRRMEHQLKLFDFLRIDHFRGFEAYWEIPAKEKTAINGKWVKAPGEKLFNMLRDSFDPLPLVAEDLGLITPEVIALREQFDLPGMKVLQFAFDSDGQNPYLPHNYDANYVVYTGTHDNSTTLGWFEALDDEVRERVDEYLGHPEEHMPWPVIRCAFASIARMAIVPLQDFLELDDAHRMNVPGVPEHNWRWRFHWDQMPLDLGDRVARLVELYGRRADLPE